MKNGQTLAFVFGAAALAACSPPSEAPAGDSDAVHGMEVARRVPDAAAGRALFVSKGCVICHSVNGVGGKAAPVLDAQVGESVVDPLDFAARIWRGAPAMIELQSVELGYAIDLTADEIANLAGFAADAAEQKKLTIDQLPEGMRDSLLDERFWEVEDWDEFLRNGQEGYGEPRAPTEPPAQDPAETPESGGSVEL